ncbi:Uncharacterised protein [Mycobacteroides abscessus]|nr:Uncharacterised protein [Mycobacteroides abscessus]
MFTSLWHRTISRSTYKDRTIHLSSTSNHVFNIIGVARAVYVSVVTSWRIVFYV